MFEQADAIRVCVRTLGLARRSVGDSVMEFGVYRFCRLGFRLMLMASMTYGKDAF